MTASRLLVCSLALGLAAGTAQAGFNAPDTGAATATGVILVETEVDQMPGDMERAYVVKLQEELLRRGYQTGSVDGLMGPRTRSAIRSYQRDVGLPDDGIASKELLEYMMFNTGGATSGPEPVPSDDPVFVRSVQIELVERGYYHGAIDGIAGPATESAVESFQRDAGLVVNGAMDQRLLEELRTQPYSVRAYGT